MSARVALLRGINLGPHKKVPMAELRDLATGLGLANPETYVQSGNLVFDTSLGEADLVEKLEAAIEDRFGFDVPVISRSGEEMAAVARTHPFADLGLDDKMLHVAFLDRAPDQPPEELIDADTYTPDRFHGNGRDVYLAYPGGLGRSKLNHGLLERKLGVRATLRNWRTVTTLAGMASTPPSTSRRGCPLSG